MDLLIQISINDFPVVNDLSSYILSSLFNLISPPLNLPLVAKYLIEYSVFDLTRFVFGGATASIQTFLLLRVRDHYLWPIHRPLNDRRRLKMPSYHVISVSRC